MSLEWLSLGELDAKRNVKTSDLMILCDSFTYIKTGRIL